MLQGTLVLAERGRLELAVRFNSLSYVHIVHAVQNTVDSCISGQRPKISGRRGRPPPTILSSQKTRINVLSYGI